MTDWNAVSAFMGAVVPWPGSEQDPGYVNLHYDLPPDPKFKGKSRGVPGWPWRNVDELVGRAGWMLGRENYKNIWYCTSLQAQKGLNTKGKAKAVRKAEHALALKAIWLDCDVKPNDTSGKNYASEAEALKAILDFQLKAGLPKPSAIVNSGSRFHVYWIATSR